MKAVNEAAYVFCLAIEEGRTLKREMLLDDDRFVIRSKVFMLDTNMDEPAEVKEPDSGSQFRIAQLCQLMEIFRRVAPSGVIAERALVYVLQDLASHGMEEGETVSLPCCWYRLRSTDISNLIGALFEHADYVDWRELIVYAMDLPMPTCQEILIARDRFRIQDQELKEVVTRVQFLRTPLWFIDCIEMVINPYEFLRDYFQRNIEDLYEEELYHLDRCDSQDLSNEIDSSSNLRSCCSHATEKLRMILAKKLLSRAYIVSQHSVNYTALLLAFCKNEDPREGFGKAVALALGSRLCTDFEEGERYVQQIYAQRRAAKESRHRRKMSDRQTLEVCLPFSLVCKFP